MKVAITEIFCELITGLALLFVLVGFFDWWEIISFEEGWSLAKAELNGVTLVALVVAAYLLGVIIDSAGLLFDEYLEHRMVSNTASDEDIKRFWTTAGAHVLAYRMVGIGFVMFVSMKVLLRLYHEITRSFS